MAMMTGRSHRLSLPEASTQFLVEELAALARSSTRIPKRRMTRASITFRPCKQCRDALPDQPIPLEAFKLLTLHHGWSAGRRGPRPALLLGIYRATFDPTTAAPIRFRAEEVHDLVRPRSLIEPRPNATAIRSGLLMHQAVDDAEPGSGMDWPRFFYGFEPERVPVFPASLQAHASSLEQSIEGLRAWPVELFVSPEVEALRGSAPTRVFASLAHLKCRSIRNPAFGILQRHALLPLVQTYRSWLATVSEVRAGLRVIQDPRSDSSEAGRLRRLIESHVLADRAREVTLLEDLDSACLALGMKLPEGPDRVDCLAGMLDNPWLPVTIPFAGQVAVVALEDRRPSILANGLVSLELEERATVVRRHPERVPRTNPAPLLRA